MKNVNTKTAGFTIIETLVAIAILITVIVGATSAAQTGLSSYIFSKDQIIAFYLAQEGFEWLRAARDENVLNSRPWLVGITSVSSDPCYFGNSCTISSIESIVPTRCSAPGACPALRQNPSNSFYGYNSSWTLTPFTREISIMPLSADEIAVTITVSWSKGGVSREFKGRENLFNWH